MNAFSSTVAGILTAALIFESSQATAQHRRFVEMPKQIIDALVSEDQSIHECIENSGGLRKTFQAESVDISKDNSSEIMIRAIAPCVCSPRKCVNRLYRKTENGYDLLLKADYAQEIEPQKYYTHGYRSLWAAVYTHGPFISVLYEYQYDGKQYQWDHCLMRFYEYRETQGGVPFSGRRRYHTRPEISYVGCDPRNP